MGRVWWVFHEDGQIAVSENSVMDNTLDGTCGALAWSDSRGLSTTA